MDDTISRQAAIDAIEITSFDDYGDYIRARELIESLSSAQPEVLACGSGELSTQSEHKKGKWVRYDGDWLKTMCKCSECGAMIDINEKYKNFFCYHCGVRMDDEQV